MALFDAGRSNSPEPASSARSTVVLYSVTDRETSQELIDLFEEETGIRVEAKFDTEAAKAVGAFFHAMLADDGCLAPAPADLIKAHGTAPRAAQGRWLSFAATNRVPIVNTDVFGP